MRFEVKELNPYFGAEITGLRLHAETADQWFPTCVKPSRTMGC